MSTTRDTSRPESHMALTAHLGFPDISLKLYVALRVVASSGNSCVALCDWYCPQALPTNATFLRLPAFTRGGDDAATRIVAVKEVRGDKRSLEEMSEIQIHRTLPPHPNIIPLYDYYSVFSSSQDPSASAPLLDYHIITQAMEGNLFQFIRLRNGRHLAAGLLSSLLHQLSSGLAHMHAHGIVHRDIKPENILFASTGPGLGHYLKEEPRPPAKGEPKPTHYSTTRDFLGSFKICDFGTAISISLSSCSNSNSNSNPIPIPPVESSENLWYRSPECLLREPSRNPPSPAVDIWGLGAVMAEVVNLQELFGGMDEVDQVRSICDVLGPPMEKGVGVERVDVRGCRIGGGRWDEGVAWAGENGFEFPEVHPQPFFTHFPESTHPLLVDCIGKMLSYDPKTRATAQDILDHLYFRETKRMRVPMPVGHTV